jgi:hypothetical protein
MSFGLCASPNPRQRSSPLETASIGQNRTGTVSEIVSQRGGGVVKNSGELNQIVIDFIGVFAIFVVSDRTF